MKVLESLAIEHHEVTIMHTTPLPERLRGHEDRFLWPSDKPMPTHYVRPQPLPCSRCRRLRLDDGAQAVLVMSMPRELAYLRCKACDYRWAMPVRPAR